MDSGQRFCGMSGSPPSHLQTWITLKELFLALQLTVKPSSALLQLSANGSPFAVSL